MRHSTGKPTKQEEAWIVACKEGPCLACMIWFGDGGYPDGGCDYHHMLSGGRRRGHMDGIGLCPWHHRGVPEPDSTVKETRHYLGPSLIDGSKVFRERYGTDEELLELQRKVLSD